MASQRTRTSSLPIAQSNICPISLDYCQRSFRSTHSIDDNYNDLIVHLALHNILRSSFNVTRSPSLPSNTFEQSPNLIAVTSGAQRARYSARHTLPEQRAQADLKGTDLKSTDLKSTNLKGTDLKGTNLKGADLKSTDKGTDLTGTDQKGTNLKGSDLKGTDLKGADNLKTPISSRYKTELCRSFREQGRCRYGAKCQFAHGSAELRSVGRHPKYKTEPCRTYHETGFCSYGPRCNFLHSATDERSIFGLERSTFGLERSTFGLERSTSGLLEFPLPATRDRSTEVKSQSRDYEVALENLKRYLLGCEGSECWSEGDVVCGASLNNSLASLTDSSPARSGAESPVVDEERGPLCVPCSLWI